MKEVQIFHIPDYCGPGIYEIVNVNNGKSYIGSSRNISRRAAAHSSKLNGRGRKAMPPPKTCANCGAPLTSGKCEYCGTVYVHDRTSAQEAQLMAELQKTVLEIQISRQLEEMNASLKQQKQQQNKSLIDRLFGR